MTSNPSSSSSGPGVLLARGGGQTTAEGACRACARNGELVRLAYDLAAAIHCYETVVAMIPRRVGELLGDACFLLLLDPAGDHLEPAAMYGPDPEFVSHARHVGAAGPCRSADGIGGHVARTGEPVVLPALDPEELRARIRPPYRELFDRHPAYGLVAMPLRAPARNLGVLLVTRHDPGRPYGEDDVGFLEALARQAAVAIANARHAADHEAAQRSLIARIRELEIANEDLESFAGSVSHDLRRPLRAIDGFAEAVLDECGDRLPPGARDHLERARSAAERMGRILDDLLRLSRVSRREMYAEPVDLSALAREVAAELPDPRRPRLADVEVVVADGMRALGDPGLLRIVLSNLLRNAWRFTGKAAAPRIEVGRTEGEDGGAVFYVRDNGAGFDMAHAARLFEPFQRLHRAEEFPGTGLGLAMCQRIVRRHGGRIWAEGAVGRGATFFFTLPTPP